VRTFLELASISPWTEGASGWVQVFQENLQFIQEWNAVPGRHRVAMNHFGDWSNEEFASIIIPAK
jgi:hypothetical protein